jgi:hypothetical protein
MIARSSVHAALTHISCRYLCPSESARQQGIRAGMAGLRHKLRHKIPCPPAGGPGQGGGVFPSAAFRNGKSYAIFFRVLGWRRECKFASHRDQPCRF